MWLDAASAFAQVSTDLVGTPLALVAPARGDEAAARRLLVMGHIDEIGLMVTHIDDDGYLWFGEVGGWDPQILIGQRVVIDTREGPVRGVVGRKPIHLLREEERKKVPETRELHIDIGASDGKQAAEHGARGRHRGDRRRARAVAQRPARLARARQPARLLRCARGGAPGGAGRRRRVGARGVAAAQEETTFGGSRTSAFALAPDAAIVVDVTHATDAPGIDVKSIGKHELGSGPVIARGSTLHEGLFELLAATARRKRIPFTIEANARSTGTDADAVHASRAGVPTAVVSIPLRYMHSPVELVQLDDVANTARLIADTALALKRDTSLAR